MAIDVDMVSDLNEGTAGDGTIPAHSEQQTTHGDAVNVNNQNPAGRETTSQAKTVGKEPAPAADKPSSIRDLISGALKAETGTPEAAKIDGGDTRPRNADGTFAAKVDEAAAPVDEAAAAAAAPPVTSAPAGIDPQVFASLPAETQATLARTMEDVATQQKRFASLEPIEQLITPRVDAWALNGMQPAQALHQLLALSDFAGRDPGGFIKYIAQNNGVDLEALVLGMDGDEVADPKYKALEDRLAGFENERKVEQQQQLQRAHDQVVGGVVAFASEKGQDGQLLRPYFEELGKDVLPFISAVKAQNPQWPHTQVLQEAYERACWGTPSVRSKMQAAVNTAGEAERLRKEAERVEAARTASASVRSGAPAAPPAAPNDPGRTTREVIKAAMALHS
jgi:hypothetical protein